MSEAILRIRDVLARVGVSRSTLRRLIEAGKFPAPVAIGSTSAKGWSSRAVDQWIAEQLATTNTNTNGESP